MKKIEAAQPVLKRLSPKKKTNKQTNKHTNKLFGAFYNLDTIFCDEKEKKGKKHVSHKYKNKLDFPFSEILAKTMRENSSPRI